MLAALLALWWGFFFFGIYDLLVFLQGPEFHEAFHLETGWGLFFVFVVAAPLSAIAAAPGRVLPAAPQQVILAAVAFGVAAGLTLSLEHLLTALGLVGTVALLAVTSRDVRASLTPPRTWHWGPGLLVLGAAAPWSAYALRLADTARAGLYPEPTGLLDQWPVLAALAIALILVGALAATLTTGWRVPAWCVAVCSAWFGIASSVYPDLDAALGRRWGLVALAWGIAFLAVSHLTAVREQSRLSHSGS